MHQRRMPPRVFRGGVGPRRPTATFPRLTRGVLVLVCLADIGPKSTTRPEKGKDCALPNPELQRNSEWERYTSSSGPLPQNALSARQH